MSIETLQDEIVQCVRCPRLATYIREVAEVKRRQFRDQIYWGKPVPSFGDPQAQLLVVGLAPAAHGGNRTGRAFTGDRSGDLLYRTLYETGFANQPAANDRNDGLRLTGAWISQIAHCAPPDNKPSPEEIGNCRHWLRTELRLLWPNLRVVVALGKIAFDGYLATLKETYDVKPRILFAHNYLNRTGNSHPSLLSSYHPSQQNTLTGRLTPRDVSGSVCEGSPALLFAAEGVGPSAGGILRIIRMRRGRPTWPRDASGETGGRWRNA